MTTSVNPFTGHVDYEVDPITGPYGPAHWISRDGAYFEPNDLGEYWWVNPDGSFYKYQPEDKWVRRYGKLRVNTAYFVDPSGLWWEWGPQDYCWVPARPAPYRGTEALVVWGLFALIVTIVMIACANTAPGGFILLLVLLIIAPIAAFARNRHPVLYDAAMVAGGAYSASRMIRRGLGN